MLNSVEHADEGAVIKVIGVGGGGGNAVAYMAKNGVDGVEFICANTDAQALRSSQAHRNIQLGMNVTKGLGAGTSPETGRMAAMEDRNSIMEALKDTNMVFITTGMGGGTGTGAAPVIAEIAKEMGILTVAVVTKPFGFEGKRRMRQAEEGISVLSKYVDSLITIPNEKLKALLGDDVSLLDAFAKADDVLCSAVRGISNIINRPGMINVDFADVKAVMSEMGMALMGSGTATGSNRAVEATEQAIKNPLLSNVNLQGARGILVSIACNGDITLGEYTKVGDIIEAFASEDAIVKIGTVIDPTMRDELQVTVVATGLDLATESAPVQKVVQMAHGHNEHRTQAAPQPEVRREEPFNPRQARPARPAEFVEHQAQNHFQEQERLAAFSDQPHDANSRVVGREPRFQGQEQSVSRHRDARQQVAPVVSQSELDYLDIPAFLRRDTQNPR